MTIRSFKNEIILGTISSHLGELETMEVHIRVTLGRQTTSIMYIVY